MADLQASLLRGACRDRDALEGGPVGGGDRAAAGAQPVRGQPRAAAQQGRLPLPAATGAGQGRGAAAGRLLGRAQADRQAVGSDRVQAAPAVESGADCGLAGGQAHRTDQLPVDPRADPGRPQGRGAPVPAPAPAGPQAEAAARGRGGRPGPHPGPGGHLQAARGRG